MEVNREDLLNSLVSMQKHFGSKEKLSAIRIIRKGDELHLRTKSGSDVVTRKLEVTGNSFNEAYIDYNNLTDVLRSIDAEQIEMFEDDSNILINDQRLETDVEDWMGYDSTPEDFFATSNSFTDRLLRVGHLATERTGVLIDHNKIVSACNFMVAIAFFEDNIINERIVFSKSVLTRIKRSDPVVGVAINSVEVDSEDFRAIHFLTKSGTIISTAMRHTAFSKYQDEILTDDHWFDVNRNDLLDLTNEIISTQNKLGARNVYIVKLTYGEEMEFTFGNERFTTPYDGDISGSMGIDMSLLNLALMTFKEDKLIMTLEDYKYQISNDKDMMIIGTGMKLRE